MLCILKLTFLIRSYPTQSNAAAGGLYPNGRARTAKLKTTRPIGGIPLMRNEFYIDLWFLMVAVLGCDFVLGQREKEHIEWNLITCSAVHTFNILGDAFSMYTMYAHLGMNFKSVRCAPLRNAQSINQITEVMRSCGQRKYAKRKACFTLHARGCAA